MSINRHSLWHAKVKHLSDRQQQPEPLQNCRESLWTRGFLSIWAVNLLVCSSGNMLVSTFPLHIVELGGSEVVVGCAAALYSVMALLMRPIAGWMLDNRSRKVIFYAGMVGIVLIPPLYALLPMIGVALALRGLHGFLWAAAGTACSTNACDIVPAGRFGEGIGYFGLTNSLAMVIGPALGLIIWNTYGGLPLFAGVALFNLAALLLLRWIPFKQVECVRCADPQPVASRLLHLFDKRSLPAAVLLFFICLPGGAVSAFIALYTTATGIGNAGLYFACQAVGTGVTRVFGGRLSDRYGEGPAIYVGGLCFLLGLALVVVESNSFLFYCGAFAYGIGYGLTMPALQTMSLRTVPLRRRGAASSTYLCSFDVSFGLGGLLGGVLVEAIGYQYMFALMSISLVSCVIIYHYWGSKTPSAHRVFLRNQQAAQQRAA